MSVTIFYLRDLLDIRGKRHEDQSCIERGVAVELRAEIHLFILDYFMSI